jgi:nucleoside-diphosphate-sugar epimerase
MGCGAVFHIASPFRYEFTDAKRDMLEPAIQGALSALKAATTEPSVRRVIFTSSVAACINPLHPMGFHRPGYVYTEADWNPLSFDEAAAHTEFPPVYTASKALAEKAAWEFMEAAPRSFDLVCINPCHTWGAYKQQFVSPAKMNATNSDLARLMNGVESTIPPTIMPWMADIDEVAQAHVNALYDPSASGRYIISNSAYDFQQVVDLMHLHFADSEWIGRVPRGTPGTRAIGEHFVLDLLEIGLIRMVVVFLKPKLEEEI